MSYQFGDDVNIIVVFAEVKDSDDVRMFKLIESFELLPHEIQVDRVLSELCLADSLDGTWHISLDVPSFMHGSKRAFSQLLLFCVKLSNVDFAVRSEVSEVEANLNGG